MPYFLIQTDIFFLILFIVQFPLKQSKKQRHQILHCKCTEQIYRQIRSLLTHYCLKPFSR